jgi:hypothetical protein
MTTLFANGDDIFDRSPARLTGKNTRQNNELAPDLDVSGNDRPLESHWQAASQPDRPQEAAIKPAGVAE